MKKSILAFISFVLISAVGKAAPVIADHDTMIRKIDTTETIMVGGIKQVISFKGEDRRNPLLLYLHGGPGSSVMNEAGGFTSKLQKHFVVAQWDQRETGKTLQTNSSPVPLTVDLMESDTQELIEYLLKIFGQKKLYLVGHSWGTVLGFAMAGKCPDLLYAYIAISPMVNQSASEQMTLSILKQKARKEQNQKEMDELKAVHIPFENWKQLYYARKWLFAYNGQPIANADTAAVQKYISVWAVTWLPVWNEAIRRNLFKELPVIKCPVYVCAGLQDYQTNFKVTETYYKQLKAPKKSLFWFKHSGHLIPNTEPDLLQDIIIEKILPDTL